MIKNKIAVIGGAGFLGSRLCTRFLNQKISFKSFDKQANDENGCFELDIEKVESLNQLKGVDTIINLAAVHRDDIRPISRYDDVNIHGSVNICVAARKFNIKKIIFTSSVAIYGFAPENTDESGSPNYFNDYGRTKYLAEQVYKKWQAEDPENRTLIIIRPTVIFGEGNRGNVYNLLNQIASGRFIMIGNGKNIKSMAYVENVAAFIEHSLSFDKGIHVYNYVDKPDFDMNTLISKTRMTIYGKGKIGLRLPAIFGLSIGYCADLLSKILGISFPVSSIRVKKFLSTTKFLSSVEQSGFMQPVNIEDALVRTIKYEFLEDNLDKRTFDSE